MKVHINDINGKTIVLTFKINKKLKPMPLGFDQTVINRINSMYHP